jgi:predicted Kef-type K+ transport protein
MAVSMSISAVPVIAKVLMDLKLIRRDIGQLILAAAMTDDTIGWILLSVVAGLAKTGDVDLLTAGTAVGGAALFLVVAFTVGVPIVSWIMGAVDKRIGGEGPDLAHPRARLRRAALTHEMGIEAVLGAFVVGILAGQAPRFRRERRPHARADHRAFLAPIFFASAGVKVDLQRLFDPEVITVGGIVLGIACVGKFLGAYLGAWATGLSHWERLAMGSGMNARGAMEIIVATIGLGLGVLNVEMYSIIVMVAIVTSLMAPPMLRWTLGRVKMGDVEAKRLESEALSAESFVRQIRRVLFVTRIAKSVELPRRSSATSATSSRSSAPPYTRAARGDHPPLVAALQPPRAPLRGDRPARGRADQAPAPAPQGLAPRGQADHRRRSRRAGARRGGARLRSAGPG